MCQSPITNIDISKEYDESLGTEEPADCYLKLIK